MKTWIAKNRTTVIVGVVVVVAAYVFYYAASDIAKAWPAGMLDRINNTK